MANDSEMKNSFKIFEDHALHRRAKLRAQKGRKPRFDDRPVYKPRVVTCPECGVTFDANIKIKVEEDKS